jgi:hypothetical protein
MPPTPNAIDVTTLAGVKLWNQTVGTNDDQIIQDAITSFSAYLLRRTGRGPLDGSIPASSPFVAPVAYDDFYDGSGTLRQPIRNWPITAVAALSINGRSVLQSTTPQISGWVIDGDKRFISMRGGGNPRGFGGYAGYGGWGANPRSLGYGGGFVNGIQNIEVQYTAGFSGVPFDLEMAARKTVALNYRRRSWIGQKSQAMAAGGGTITFADWEMDKDVERAIQFYMARVA